MIYKCSNPAQWHPTMHTRQKHHHPPLAWRRVILNQNGNADDSWWRLIDMCGLCHDEYHTLLNAYVKLGKAPTGPEMRTYSPYIKNLVAEVWKHKPEGKLPYTISKRDLRLAGFANWLLKQVDNLPPSWPEPRPDLYAAAEQLRAVLAEVAEVDILERMQGQK